MPPSVSGWPTCQTSMRQARSKPLSGLFRLCGLLVDEDETPKNPPRTLSPPQPKMKPFRSLSDENLVAAQGVPGQGVPSPKRPDHALSLSPAHVRRVSPVQEAAADGPRYVRFCIASFCGAEGRSIRWSLVTAVMLSTFAQFIGLSTDAGGHKRTLQGEVPARVILLKSTLVCAQQARARFIRNVWTRVLVPHAIFRGPCDPAPRTGVKEGFDDLVDRIPEVVRFISWADFRPLLPVSCCP
jgi:hypothetical protein